jgi:ADP-heptose:LPS heptosyltransferase
MGDAILAVPSLQAIREKSADAEITFYANKAVRDVLTPNSLCDKWLTQKSGCALKNALQLRKYNFSKVILYKNSFASGFAVFLG